MFALYLSAYFGLVLQISISDEHDEILSLLIEFIFKIMKKWTSHNRIYIYNHLVKLSSNQSINDDASIAS